MGLQCPERTMGASADMRTVGRGRFVAGPGSSKRPGACRAGGRPSEERPPSAARRGARPSSKLPCSHGREERGLADHAASVLVRIARGEAGPTEERRIGKSVAEKWFESDIRKVKTMNIGEFKNVNGRLMGSIATRTIDLPRIGLRPVESQ